jgi:hypothetical protein
MDELNRQILSFGMILHVAALSTHQQIQQEEQKVFSKQVGPHARQNFRQLSQQMKVIFCSIQRRMHGLSLYLTDNFIKQNPDHFAFFSIRVFDMYSEVADISDQVMHEDFSDALPEDSIAMADEVLYESVKVEFSEEGCSLVRQKVVELGEVVS